MSDESETAKAERYLEMATEVARQAAKSSDPQIATAYLDMAAVWMRLAEDLMKHHRAANDDPEAADDARQA